MVLCRIYYQNGEETWRRNEYYFFVITSNKDNCSLPATVVHHVDRFSNFKG